MRAPDLRGGGSETLAHRERRGVLIYQAKHHAYRAIRAHDAHVHLELAHISMNAFAGQAFQVLDALAKTIKICQDELFGVLIN